MKIFLANIIGLAFFLLPLVAHTVTYWIDPTGSDGNACSAVDGDSDPGTYRLTFEGAYPCLSSGDTLNANAGTYVEALEIDASVPNGVDANNHTIIQGTPGDTVILRPTSGGSGRVIRVRTSK